MLNIGLVLKNNARFICSVLVFVLLLQCTIKVVHYNSKNKQDNTHQNNPLKQYNMNTIVTAATLLNMYFNVQVTGTSQNYYNPNIENGQVKSVEIYNSNGSMLDRNLKCFFTYDDQNRLVSKQAMKWNEQKEAYEPYYLQSYYYGDNGYTVDYCRWNNRTQNYELASERIEYTTLDNGIIAVSHYKQDDAKSDWALVNRFVEMTVANENLWALK